MHIRISLSASLALDQVEPAAVMTALQAAVEAADLPAGARLESVEATMVGTLTAVPADAEIEAVDAREAALLDALRQDPRSSTVYDGLERLYTEREQWGKLVSVLRRQAMILLDSEERDMVLEKIRILEQDTLTE